MSSINDVLEKLKANYSYMNFSDKVILSDVKNIIKLVDKNNNYYDSLYKMVSTYYDSLIKKSIDESDYSYIYGYIISNIKYSKKIDVNVNSASLFANYLLHFGDFDKNINKYIDIINNSRTLNKIFSSIIDKFGMYYPDFVDNNTLIDMLDSYCLINKIELLDEISSFTDEYEIEDSYYLDYYDSSDVRFYINEINKIPLLSSEEERELAIKYFDNHDMDARKKLIEHNLRLCIKPASKYKNKGVPFMDLIENANMGLIKAVDRFNPHKGFKFSTYAIYWIYNTLLYDFNNNVRIVSVPYKKQLNINKYIKIKEDLSKKLGKELTYSDIASNSNISIEDVYFFENAIQPDISINVPIGENLENELVDIIPDESIESFDDNISNGELRSLISSLLDNFSKRQKMIIMIRFGLYDGIVHTLDETARMLYKFGIDKKVVSHENIRQIENRVLKKLREPKNSSKLFEYYK